MIGAGSNIESVSTDVINGRNVLLAEINLGESGGQINKEFYMFLSLQKKEKSNY